MFGKKVIFSSEKEAGSVEYRVLHLAVILQAGVIASWHRDSTVAYTVMLNAEICARYGDASPIRSVSLDHLLNAPRLHKGLVRDYKLSQETL